MIAEILRSGIRDGNLPYKVEILKNIYRSANYYTDDYKGVCEDGDYRAIRYVNAENGRVFKMKIGKLYRKLILETAIRQNIAGAGDNVSVRGNSSGMADIYNGMPAAKPPARRFEFPENIRFG